MTLSEINKKHKLRVGDDDDDEMVDESESVEGNVDKSNDSDDDDDHDHQTSGNDSLLTNKKIKIKTFA